MSSYSTWTADLGIVLVRKESILPDGDKMTHLLVQAIYETNEARERILV
jgi:hypothetical protein